jgi:hypothetical protein
MVRAGLIFLFGCALSSCSSTTDQILRQSVGYECHNRDSSAGDFICSQNDETVATDSRYCYNTLGDVNCFDRPDPDRNSQPNGSTGF